jgi:hypothetical protein
VAESYDALGIEASVARVSNTNSQSIRSQPRREEQLCLEEAAVGSAHLHVDVGRAGQKRTRDDRAEHVASLRVGVLAPSQPEAPHVVAPLPTCVPEVEENVRYRVAPFVQDVTPECQQDARGTASAEVLSERRTRFVFPARLLRRQFAGRGFRQRRLGPRCRREPADNGDQSCRCGGS